MVNLSCQLDTGYRQLRGEPSTEELPRSDLPKGMSVPWLLINVGGLPLWLPPSLGQVVWD